MSTQPMTILLNKDLVQLKQKLEILQSVYVFFKQLREFDTTQEKILKEIDRVIQPLATPPLILIPKDSEVIDIKGVNDGPNKVS